MEHVTPAPPTSLPEQPELAHIADAFEHHFPTTLKALLLFGSRARGTQCAESDYDIYAIIDNLPTEPIARLKLVRMALFDIEDRVNVIARTPREVEKDLSPLLMEVCVDGKTLFGAQYFEPMRQRGLEAISQSGMIRERVGSEWFWHFPGIQKKPWELTWSGYRELR